ncbi:hypothetical protein GH784_23030 [Agrobacterium sp. CNPSo 675]|nr:hypothetical protein [Agrobacterium tumefaciens]
MNDHALSNVVREALLQLEADGHIVIVSTTIGPIVDAIVNKVADVFPRTDLSIVLPAQHRLEFYQTAPSTGWQPVF